MLTFLSCLWDCRLRTTLCLQYEPHYIAAGSLYLAAEYQNVKLRTEKGRAWWQEFDVSLKLLEGLLIHVYVLLPFFLSFFLNLSWCFFFPQAIVILAYNNVLIEILLLVISFRYSFPHVSIGCHILGVESTSLLGTDFCIYPPTCFSIGS